MPSGDGFKAKSSEDRRCNFAERLALGSAPSVGADLSAAASAGGSTGGSSLHLAEGSLASVATTGETKLMGDGLTVVDLFWSAG